MGNICFWALGSVGFPGHCISPNEIIKVEKSIIMKIMKFGSLFGASTQHDGISLNGKLEVNYLNLELLCQNDSYHQVSSFPSVRSLKSTAHHEFLADI
jgi:hypothetical protein